MKKVHVWPVVFAMVFVVSSCKKENWDEASFRCKVNGEEFIATEKFANATLDLNTGEPHSLRVSGTRLPNFFNKKKLDGEMKLNGMYFYDHEIGIEMEGQSQFFYFGNNNLDQTIRSNTSLSTGKYRIEAIDQDAKRIKGTFEVKAYDENGGVYDITEGYFDVEYE